MKDLFKFVKVASTLEIDKIIVFFSTGKDSLATLDLCAKNIRQVVAVYLYTVKGLSFREKYFEYIRKRYPNVAIVQHPFPDLADKLKKNINTKTIMQKITLSTVQNFLRNKYDCDWVSYGFKYNDSLHRRGFLKFYGEVDQIHKKYYPIAHWSDKDVFNYLKKIKMPLPIEYSYGFRDITVYDGDGLIWLANNYPEDYEKVRKMFPMIEGELIKAYDKV